MRTPLPLILFVAIVWFLPHAPAQDDALDDLLGETLDAEEEGGEFFTDFGDGQIGLVEVSERAALRPKSLAVTKHGGKDALELQGRFHSCVYYGGRKWRDGVLETRICKTGGSYAGVVVRDKVFVYLQMRGLLCVNQLNGGTLFQSGKEFRGYHNLKVVFVGPALRVSVDGELICILRVEPSDGRAGVYSHNGQAYYRSLRISSAVDPLDGLLVEPQAPGDALVFGPGTAAGLGVRIENFSSTTQALSVRANALTWGGDPLGREQRSTAQVRPNDEATVALDFGSIPAGFHRIKLVVMRGDAEVSRQDDLPLAVQERGSASQAKRPVVPVAAYSKYFNTRGGLYQNTYAHAIARLLRDHHFNSVVEDPSFTPEVVDIFRSYGISLIARGSRYLARSGCFAALAGDEPKWAGLDDMRAQYAELTPTGKPVTTCLVGEGMGLGGHGPVAIWNELNPPLRAFRWYGVKKSYYNPLHDLKYKGWLPLSSVLRIAEASSDTPWWFIAPSFGVTQHEGYYMNPTPAEMRAMMHLAMAYGANGQMLWCLQSWGKWQALIKQQSLAPEDGKLAAVGKAAAVIAEHAPLLASLGYGGFEVGNSNPIHIAAVPRRAAAGRAYIYAVNRDAKEARSTRLKFLGGDGPVRDLFSGASLSAGATPDGIRSLTITLGPGRAALVDTGATVPAPKPAQAYADPPPFPAGLAASVESAVAEQGVAVESLAMSDVPCVPGDAIGLSRVDDPRHVWDGNPDAVRVLSWSGHLHERTAPGFLPLASALRVAEAANKPYWAAFPALARTRPSPGELRGMLHLALALGARAVLVPDSLDAESAAAVDRVADFASTHGKLLSRLRHGGPCTRCYDARIAAFPRHAEDDLYIYAVNLDPRETITTELMVWDEVWDWTAARDLYAQADIAVSPVNAEGYLTCRVTLKPGEGKLIHTDSKINKRK